MVVVVVERRHKGGSSEHGQRVADRRRAMRRISMACKDMRAGAGSKQVCDRETALKRTKCLRQRWSSLMLKHTSKKHTSRQHWHTSSAAATHHTHGANIARPFYTGGVGDSKASRCVAVKGPRAAPNRRGRRAKQPPGVAAAVVLASVVVILGPRCAGEVSAAPWKRRWRENSKGREKVRRQTRVSRCV